MPSDVAVLTLGRVSEIYDGVGEPPTKAELAEYEKYQALQKRVMQRLLPSLQEAARLAVAAREVVGCDLSEVVEVHGSQYGPLTARDVLEQAERGLRGRRALDAALESQMRLLRTRSPAPRTTERCRTSRAPRSRRVRTSRTSHGPPGRLSADDDPDLADQLGALISEWGPQSAAWLRCETGRRKTDVLEALRVGPFVKVGDGRSTTWDIAPPSPELERYRNEIWKARRRGVIDALDAIELLIEPKPQVLAMLAEAVA
jgi:hypothetical protein